MFIDFNGSLNLIFYQLKIPLYLPKLNKPNWSQIKLSIIPNPKLEHNP